nr:PREDICTED: 5-hydroxytryptamine receptor 3A-like [Lepisosteus oculatus]
MTNSILPNNSGGTPLIGGYFLVWQALLVFSLLESMFVVYVLHGKYQTQMKVPSWVRTLAMCYLAKLINYKVDWSCQHENEERIFTIKLHKSRDDTSCLEPDRKTLNSEDTMRVLCKICNDVEAICSSLKKHHKKEKGRQDWTEVTCILDRFLFHVYIVFVAVCVLCLCVLWNQWYIR